MRLDIAAKSIVKRGAAGAKLESGGMLRGSTPPREKFAEKTDGSKRRIDAVDRAIDAIVYQLYGLTDEDIKIVET